MKGLPAPKRLDVESRIVRIRAQFAEILRVDVVRQWQEQEQNEEDDPHGEPPTSGLSLMHYSAVEQLERE